MTRREPKIKNKEGLKSWKKLIKKSLNKKSIGTCYWGCLRKNGLLFLSSSLQSTQVPISVVRKMESKGIIYLDDFDYYQLMKYKK